MRVPHRSKGAPQAPSAYRSSAKCAKSRFWPVAGKRTLASVTQWDAVFCSGCWASPCQSFFTEHFFGEILASTIFRSPVDCQKAVHNLLALQADGRAVTAPAVQAVVEAIEHYKSVTKMGDRDPTGTLVGER